MKVEDQVRPLSSVKAGNKVVLVRIDAGRGLNSRLASMGLVANQHRNTRRQQQPSGTVRDHRQRYQSHARAGHGAQNHGEIAQETKARFFLQPKFATPNFGQLLSTRKSRYEANHSGPRGQSQLPGTYSLTAYSTEELIARRFILEESPDVVVDVVDASNIERNLYLGTQIIEMNVPLIFAFNMSDVAKRRGLEFNLEQLSRLLQARIVPTVGNKGEGGPALLDAIVETAAEGKRARTHKVTYGGEIEEELAKIGRSVREHRRRSAEASSTCGRSFTTKRRSSWPTAATASSPAPARKRSEAP